MIYRDGLEGTTTRRTPPGLADALRRLREGERRPATEDDRPPVSTFPMTSAARAALAYSRGLR